MKEQEQTNAFLENQKRIMAQREQMQAERETDRLAGIENTKGSLTRLTRMARS